MTQPALIRGICEDGAGLIKIAGLSHIRLNRFFSPSQTLFYQLSPSPIPANRHPRQNKTNLKTWASLIIGISKQLKRNNLDYKVQFSFAIPVTELANSDWGVSSLGVS